MPSTAWRFDLEPLAKLRFVATVLPVLGTLGGLLKVNGQSDQAVLVVVVPLLFISFFGWRFWNALRNVREAAANVERQFWESHDARAVQRLTELVEAQREEIRNLRVRQQEEQERLLRQNPSAQQLARMMERHRSEYEALLNRRTA